MRRLFTIFLSVLLGGCFTPETSKFELSENDVYEIINEHVITKLSRENNATIYWATLMIEEPTIDSSYYDELIVDPRISAHFKFTNEMWDTAKIEGVEFISSEEYEYYFNGKLVKEREKEWLQNYERHYLHCLSYPKIIPKTKSVVIKHIMNRPNTSCGTGLFHAFVYEKTENGWKEKR